MPDPTVVELVAANERLLARLRALRRSGRHAAADLARPGGNPPMAGARLLASRDAIAGVESAIRINLGAAAERLGRPVPTPIEAEPWAASAN